MYKLSAFIALLTALPVLGQSPCSQITIDRFRYEATDPTVLELVVNNQSNEIFGYPSFVLVDDLGDTLAREQVAFFGIGSGPQAHYLLTEPGATIPTGLFDATLLLFSGFGDTLWCTWELTDLALCPPDSCVQAEIYLTNTGPLVAFNASWWLTNIGDGTVVATGIIPMDDLMPTHFDTVCLPPGDYVLEFSPFSPIDTDYVAGITTSYNFSLGTNVALQQDNTPLDLHFSWFSPCISQANAITENDAIKPIMVIDDGRLTVSDPEGRALGEVTLWSVDGRLVSSRSTNGSTMQIEVQGSYTGILLARVISPNGSSFVQRLLIP